MQMLVSDKGFVHVVPMQSKKDFLLALKLFAKEIGVPEALIVDPSGEQTLIAVRKYCYQIGTTLRMLEEHTQWANRAELYIGLLKESIQKDMKESNFPLILWDYCTEHCARIHNLTTKSLFQLNDQNLMSVTLGDEGDISNLCNFNWYDWCYYREQSSPFLVDKDLLGRVLGPAKNAVNEMTQWILKGNGRIVPRRTVRPLKPEELAASNEVEFLKRRQFTQIIKQIYGDSISFPPKRFAPDSSGYIPYEDDEVQPVQQSMDEDPVDHECRAIGEQPVYDRLIHAELALPQGEEMQNVKVLCHSIGDDVKTIGHYNENPILNTIVYDV